MSWPGALLEAVLSCDGTRPSFAGSGSGSCCCALPSMLLLLLFACCWCWCSCCCFCCCCCVCTGLLTLLLQQHDDWGVCWWVVEQAQAPRQAGATTSARAQRAVQCPACRAFGVMCLHACSTSAATHPNGSQFSPAGKNSELAGSSSGPSKNSSAIMCVCFSVCAGEETCCSLVT